MENSLAKEDSLIAFPVKTISVKNRTSLVPSFLVGESPLVNQRDGSPLQLLVGRLPRHYPIPLSSGSPGVIKPR